MTETVPAPSELTCRDSNGDGIIDIPISTLMPGYSSSDEDENIYRIDYQNLHDGELLPAYSVVSNREMGYIFLMPDELGGQCDSAPGHRDQRMAVCGL